MRHKRQAEGLVLFLFLVMTNSLDEVSSLTGITTESSTISVSCFTPSSVITGL